MEKMVSLKIKSKVENIFTAECAVIEKAESMGFDSDCCFCIRLAMDEALVNAIIHGNENQEEKEIHVTASYNEDRIVVSIRDEGDGFDQSILIDPREEPYLHQTHGRGVFLIRQFTENVRFNEKGNEIIFTVHREKSVPALPSS